MGYPHINTVIGYKYHDVTCNDPNCYSFKGIRGCYVHSYIDLNGNKHENCNCCDHHTYICIICDKPALKSDDEQVALFNNTIYQNAKIPFYNMKNMGYMLTCSQKCQQILDAECKILN